MLIAPHFFPKLMIVNFHYCRSKTLWQECNADFTLESSYRVYKNLVKKLYNVEIIQYKVFIWR